MSGHENMRDRRWKRTWKLQNMSWRSCIRKSWFWRCGQWRTVEDFSENTVERRKRTEWITWNYCWKNVRRKLYGAVWKLSKVLSGKWRMYGNWWKCTMHKVWILVWNLRDLWIERIKKASAFSASKSSDTRNSETGAEEYTIPASNAFGLPHRFPVCQSSGSLSGRIPETLRKIYNMEKQETWRKWFYLLQEYL